MPSSSDKITSIGAGLTGPLLAISLVQRGFRVTIYERRPDPRRVRLSAGRSINLAISVRGIHALARSRPMGIHAQYHHPDERPHDALALWRAYVSALRKK